MIYNLQQIFISHMYINQYMRMYVVEYREAGCILSYVILRYRMMLIRHKA